MSAGVLAVMLAAVTAGCSGGKDDQKATSLDPDKPITLKVGVPQAFGYFAAMWKRNVQIPGVRVEYQYFADPNSLNDAINSGSVDIEDQGEIGPIQMAANRSTAKVVACTASNGRNSNIIVRPGVSAKTFADLKGKRIAYAQNNNHKLFVLHLLKQYGMQEKDITSVNILGVEAVNAFVSGRVDATSQNSPTAAQILEKVPGSRVIARGDQAGITNLYCALATEKAVENKAPAIRAFITEYEKTIRWAKANPDAYTKLVAKPLGVSENAARTALNNNAGGLQRIDSAFLANEQKYADEITASGIVRNRVDVKNLFLTDFDGAVEHPLTSDGRPATAG
ncbi:ABC transporter substrate-binding protein [Spirillospora sp. CA-108201]